MWTWSSRGGTWCARPVGLPQSRAGPGAGAGHVVTVHPQLVWRSPSAARRARLTAAARREKSAATCGAADSGASPAVAAAHQVSDLAFHLRAGGAVVGDPGGIGLGGAGIGQSALVGADRDRCGRRREPVHARASGQAGAGRAEHGGAAAGGGRADRRRSPGRAGDGARVQVDGEAVLGEPAARCGRRLRLAVKICAPAVSSLASSLPVP